MDSYLASRGKFQQTKLSFAAESKSVLILGRIYGAVDVVTGNIFNEEIKKESYDVPKFRKGAKTQFA